MHFGIDVSSNNHPGGVAIDWQAAYTDMKARGAGAQPFAIIKATEGTGYVNPFFAGDVASARAAGFAVGAYLMDHGSTDAAAEEAFFRRIAGPLPQFDDDELPDGMSPATYAAHCAQLVAQNPAAADYLNQTEEDEGFPPGAGIWEANYNGQPGVTHRPALIHQYGSTGVVAGIVGEVDLNAFLGTEAQFGAFFSNVATVAAAIPPTTFGAIALPGESMRILTAQNVSTDSQGNGWVDFDLGGSQVCGSPYALAAQPGAPAPRPDGDRYDHVHCSIAIGAAAGHQRVTVVDAEPSAAYGVSLPVAP